MFKPGGNTEHVHGVYRSEPLAMYKTSHENRFVTLSGSDLLRQFFVHFRAMVGVSNLLHEMLLRTLNPEAVACQRLCGETCTYPR